MPENPDNSALHRESNSDNARKYYDDHTQGLYLSGWNRDHIHLGLFEPGECPAFGEKLADSAGLARALERMIEVVIEPADIQAHHHVVDAGCGVGGTAIHLAKTRGCRITGVNLSPLQLEIAAEKASDAGVAARVRFKHADCSLSLPFADASIDVVVNIESACHYSDRAQFLREVCRILKPSGRIAAVDWMVPDGLSREKYDKYTVPMCKAYALHDLESPSTYCEKLRAAGLEVAQFEGFHGKDADNLRLFKDGYRLLDTLRFYGMEFPGRESLIDQMRTMRDAWTNESFMLNRYFARKP